MIVRIQTPAIYLWFIRAISLLVPWESRPDWRREWEAEIFSRWLLLKRWERLNTLSKLDLLKRVVGSVFDVLCFQQRRTSLVLVAFNMLVALLTGFGALEHFIIRGIGDRQMQPLLLSLAAITVSILFITSGIALFRRWPKARRLITLTGTLSVLLHVYGVLPPHRNMGFFILIVGAGYGLVMVVVFNWNEKRNLVL
jgi:Na+/melibiose symporter-like transporter